MTFTLDTTTIKTIALVESLTGAKIKDCIPGETFVFIFEEEKMGRVFAQRKRLEQLLKKKVRLVAFHPDLLQFIKNLVYPLEVEKKEEKDGVVYLTGKDTETRAMLIGRNGHYLRMMEDIVKRYFPIKEIKVVQ